MMGGIGSLAGVAFGLIWTFAAASTGAPIFVPLFGVVFIALGVMQALYHFRNATGESRYSAFDITDGQEEPDPLNERFGAPPDGDPTAGGTAGGYCPYCGQQIGTEHQFCRHCGRRVD